MSSPMQSWLRPASRMDGCAAYAPPPPPCPVDLRLNNNEGPPPPVSLIDVWRSNFAELVRRYPCAVDLEHWLAQCHGRNPESVIVTAGADDAIQRACMAMLDRGREVILPAPTFEMFGRYARMAGGEVLTVPWFSGKFPTEAMLDLATDRTAMIVVVSPNNPTGLAAREEDLARLSAAIPDGLLLVDAVYEAFADRPLTDVALHLPNALVVHSLSKAWGLAGLRVGYALGPQEVVKWLRAAGNPFAVSGLSLAIAMAWLRSGEEWTRAFAAEVREQRPRLMEALIELGAEPLPSQANFVLARFRDAEGTWRSLARHGIAVRAFPAHPQLKDYLRITCPGEAASFDRLLAALAALRYATPMGAVDE